MGGWEGGKNRDGMGKKNQKEDRIRMITLSFYPMRLINKQVKLEREAVV